MNKFSSFDEIYEKIITSCKIEIDHKYIDFFGKRTNFSKFILSTLYLVLKKINKTERHRVEKLISHFEQYHIDSPSARAHSIQLLIETFAYFKKYLYRSAQYQFRNFGSSKRYRHDRHADFI